LNTANIIESKRNRKSNFKYAQLVYKEWMKISQFHVAFMIEVWIKKENNEIKFSKLSEDAKYLSSRLHVSDFSSLSSQWRKMLKHLYAAQWQKAAQIEYDVSRIRCLRHWWTSMKLNIKKCKDVDY
jgi:hypothetical protein